MKLIQLLWSSIFLLNVTIFSFSVEAKYYVDYNIDVTFYNEDIEDIIELSTDIKQLNEYFTSIFLYRLQEPISITIMPSVWDLTSTFAVSKKVGAVWVNNSSFFQPINVIKKMGKYNKTCFTEFSHFYINSFTSGKCESWFIEGLSYYLWINYSGESSIKAKRVFDPSFLKEFSSYMDDEEQMRNFYYNFLIYMDQILLEDSDLKSILRSHESYE